MAALVAERVLVATRSAGKLCELIPLLRAGGWCAESLTDAGIAHDPHEELLEAFDTFEANARAKATYFAERAPGRIVLADDSGLAADALRGGPGVASKRWSVRPDLSGDALDAANNVHLQRALNDAARHGEVSRAARYICAAACVWPGGELVALGETRGTLLTHPRGTNGFGYDGYFLSTELGQTFAEVSREAKAAVSHRGRAFVALLALLAEAQAHGQMLQRPVDPLREGG